MCGNVREHGSARGGAGNDPSYSAPSDLAPYQIDDGVIQKFLDHKCTCAQPDFFIQMRGFGGSSSSRARIVKFADFLVRPKE